MEQRFHKYCGKNITFSNCDQTAIRNNDEFNHGIVFSALPLEPEVSFEVTIDKKMNNWSGSIEIGVVDFDPCSRVLPSTATKLMDSSWIYTGRMIVHDGVDVTRVNFGKHLVGLEAGESVGVMYSSREDIEFIVNGKIVGFTELPVNGPLYALFNVYGKCVQISVLHRTVEERSKNPIYDPSICHILTLLTCPGQSSRVLENVQIRPHIAVSMTMPSNSLPNTGATSKGKKSKIIPDMLRFHQRCGSLVMLSPNGRTAERRHPLGEFNNGVVMTHRFLYDDELFEIRIDRLVDKWSGSIEVGVTTHNPTALEFPATMTNMRSGTTMMSGCGILTNGKASCCEYGQFNLDELREGDRIGMMRSWNGNLHFFINGLNQGVAATKLAQHVWGVIDLYGMTVRVSIVDRDEKDMISISTREESVLKMEPLSVSNSDDQADPRSHESCGPTDAVSTSDKLLFHPNCGAHAVVINNGLTAHRPHAMDDFNNGVVLTSRPLHPDELFEVILEKVVCKWAGSIEIGVTTHSPNDLDFPFTMTNMRSGTWMMSGQGVMHNQISVIDRYSNSLDRMVVGDRVGVLRESCGTLRFFVNGVDLGPATTGVPENIYGVIDLYGQAAQASIVNSLNSPDSLHSSVSNTTLHGGELCFHRLHGHNVRVQNGGMVATQAFQKFGPFSDAIVFSSRPLRECEMFQIKIEKIGDRCSGCMSFGVIAACPTAIRLRRRAHQLSEDVYTLTGNLLTHGFNLSEPYPLDLSNLSVGSRVGVMRHADRSVHFYLDGMDQGKAWDVQPINIYAILDLFGSNSEVSISPPKGRGFNGNSDNSLMMLTAGLLSCHSIHSFSEYCGQNIKMNHDNTVARVRSIMSYSNLVFSASLLRPDEVFEVEVEKIDKRLAGSMRIGITDVNILNAHINRNLPSTILELPSNTIYIEGRFQFTVGKSDISPVSPSLEWLKVKDRIGLRRIGYSDCIALQINGEEIGVVFQNVPDKVFIVFELCGRQTGIRVVSVARSSCEDGAMDVSDEGNSLHLIDSLDPLHANALNDCVNPSTRVENTGSAANPDQAQLIGSKSCCLVPKRQTGAFLSNHGDNIYLEGEGKTAKRSVAYNHGIVIASKPITRGQHFQVKVTNCNSYWNSFMMIGVSKISQGVNLSLPLPSSAAELRQGCWVVSHDHLYLDGNVKWSDYGKPLETLQIGSTVTLSFTECGELQLIIDGNNLGSFTKIFTKINKLYPLVDLYGRCEQVSIYYSDDVCDLASEMSAAEEIETNAASKTSDTCQTERSVGAGGSETSHNDAIHQLEKADLEYHEKENFSINITTGSTLPLQASAYSMSQKMSGMSIDSGRLPRSVSENECRNIIIQNLSLTVSPYISNEVKNMEIKQRTVVENSIEQKKTRSNNYWKKSCESTETPNSCLNLRKSSIDITSSFDLNDGEVFDRIYVRRSQSYDQLPIPKEIFRQAKSLDSLNASQPIEMDLNEYAIPTISSEASKDVKTVKASTHAHDVETPRLSFERYYCPEPRLLGESHSNELPMNLDDTNMIENDSNHPVNYIIDGILNSADFSNFVSPLEHGEFSEPPEDQNENLDPTMLNEDCNTADNDIHDIHDDFIPPFSASHDPLSRFRYFGEINHEEESDDSECSPFLVRHVPPQTRRPTNPIISDVIIEGGLRMSETCEYFDSVVLYKISLQIDNRYFKQIAPVCYCGFCIWRPLTKVPFGWVKFELVPRKQFIGPIIQQGFYLTNIRSVKGIIVDSKLVPPLFIYKQLHDFHTVRNLQLKAENFDGCDELNAQVALYVQIFPTQFVDLDDSTEVDSDFEDPNADWINSGSTDYNITALYLNTAC